MKETGEVIVAAAELVSVGVDAYRQTSWLDKLRAVGKARDAVDTLLRQLQDIDQVRGELSAMWRDPQASGALVTLTHSEGLKLIEKVRAA